MKNKKLIRLTESDLHRIVKESVNKILNEIDDADLFDFHNEMNPDFLKQTNKIRICCYKQGNGADGVYFDKTFNDVESAYAAYERLCKEALKSEIEGLKTHNLNFILAPSVQVEKDTLYGKRNLFAGKTRDTHRFVDRLYYHMKHNHIPYEETAKEILSTLRNRFDEGLTDFSDNWE